MFYKTMATKTPFKFPLPDYFVDIENTCSVYSSWEFETLRDGEVVSLEAMMISADGTTDNYFLCFRDLNEPFLSALPCTAPPSRGKRPFRCPSSNATHLHTVAGALIERGAGRFIFLVDAEAWAGHGLYWLYLSSDWRAGVWISYDRPSETGGFSIESEFPDFVSALNKSESDIRFALHWSHLSLEERNSLNTFYTNGDEKELREVVRAIAFYESAGEEHDRLIYRNGFLCHDWMRKYIKIGPPPPRYILPYPAPTLRLEMWGKHVRNYFYIHGDTELMRKHQLLDPMRPEIVVECAQATQHERLEAALFLRDWAKDKIPPDELRLLLPKL